ncbi:hypothetical protein ACOSP7_007949 [Xanthoceras sorbifolium]
MNPRASAVSLLLVLFFSATATLSINAFDISKILSNGDSDFSSFNELLKQTGLAQKINSQQTITVLALDGGAVGSIQGKPKEELERILSNHVVLDYYDMDKLKKLTNKSTTLTTMFQKTGLAQSGLGFLNVTKTSSGDIMLGSGVKDAPLVARVMKQVASQPYNISVIQISQAIVAPGIDNIDASSQAPTNAAHPPTPPKKKAASPPKKAEGPSPPAPSPEEESADAPEGDAPAQEPSADEPSGASRALVSSGAAAVAALMGLMFVGL